MKPKVFFSLMLLILSTFLYISDTTAGNEPYTQWSLPEGAKARLGKGRINDITCSPDGALLAVASRIGIWLYDIQTGEALALLTGHTGTVDRIAFSPDGKTLASGGQDNTLRLWDVDTQKEIATLEGHTGRPNSIWFSPDGRTLVSRDDDNPHNFFINTTVRIWDVDTQTQIHTLEEHDWWVVNNIAFSPDGKTLASGGSDEIVRLWDVDTRTEIGTLQGHVGYVSSVSFSPDGKTIASGGQDTTLRLWDVDTQTQIGILEGHTRRINSVSFSPDGKTIATGSIFDVRLWDVDTQTQIGILEVHTYAVHSVSFSPDGKTIAGWQGGNWVNVWDVNKQTRATTRATLGLFREHIWEVLWVIDALVDAEKRNIYTILTEPVGHISAVNSVAFSPDGRTLVSASTEKYNLHNDYTVLWDVDTFTQIGTLDIHDFNSVAFSPDGHTLATARDHVYLWDVHTQTQIGRLLGYVRSVAFSPDGHTLASSSGRSSGRDYFGSGTVHLWNVHTQTEIGRHWEHIGAVNSVSFSPDGHTLASAGSVDGTVRLWDVATWTEIAILKGHTGWVNDVSFSPDGKIIVSASHDRTVRLWDVATWTEIAILKGHTGRINSVSFSPDGKIIVSGDQHGTVRLWDVTTLTGMGILEGHTRSVNSVSFSPGGKTIASGSDDGTVLLWNITSVDHGNTLFEATALLLGGSLTAQIDPGTDVDYFSVPIEVRGQLTLWTTTTDSLNMIGTLQNSDGTTLATNANENGDEALDFRIEHVVEPGTYYIKVESEEQQTGDYTLYAAFIPATDVNRDGVVDVLDLMIVAENFGRVDTPLTGDVNGDGEVNREDIIAVLDALDAAAAAPAISTTESLQRWIDQAKQLYRTDARFQKGIAVLQNLLTTLRETQTIPKVTALLANYPNPFNPETWIPYQLEKPADVTLMIYSVEGAFVRTLALGHHTAGMYQSRSRAAYWDGKNMIGEPVASGLYFYTLTAGEFTATRKMLIRK